MAWGVLGRFHAFQYNNFVIISPCSYAKDDVGGYTRTGDRDRVSGIQSFTFGMIDHYLMFRKESSVTHRRWTDDRDSALELHPYGPPRYDPRAGPG